MREITILRLAQMVVACVCIISGAAVARSVMRVESSRWVHLGIGAAISVVFVYAALVLGTRGIYTYG